MAEITEIPQMKGSALFDSYRKVAIMFITDYRCQSVRVFDATSSKAEILMSYIVVNLEARELLFSQSGCSIQNFREYLLQECCFQIQPLMRHQSPLH